MTFYRDSHRLGISIGTTQVWVKREKPESLIKA